MNLLNSLQAAEATDGKIDTSVLVFVITMEFIATDV